MIEKEQVLSNINLISSNFDLLRRGVWLLNFKKETRYPKKSIQIK